MSLRQKTMITVSVGICLLMLTVYLLLSSRILASALSLEERDLVRNLTRAKNAILDDLRQLEVTTLDWAVFDETYDFVQQPNQAYINRNLNANLEILNLDYFIIQKRDRIILTRQKVLDAIYVPSIETLDAFVLPDQWLWHQPQTSLQRMQRYSVISGLVSRANDLYFAAQAPIVSSSTDRVSSGQLTMLRQLDIEALKRLSELTQVRVSVLNQNKTRFSGEQKDIVARLLTGEQRVLQKTNPKEIQGYTLLSRIGEELLVLEVRTDRATYQTARAFLAQLAWSLLVIGIFVTALMIGLLQFGLLSRLTKVYQELTQVALSGDISHRLTVRGADELGKLTRQINASLARVEETQIQSAKLEARLERLRSTQLQTSLEETRLDVFERLARIAEFRDNETGLHTNRVGEISYALALELGLPQDEAQRIGYASRLHDIGKIAIPDSILFKPSGLDADEWQLMQTHVSLGGQMLEGSDSPLLETARLIALTHHERWNGSGYPNGLRGEEIPLLGRIVAVADSLDALTSPRPYKPAWRFQDALDEINMHSEHLYDPRVVAALLKIAPKLAKETHESTEESVA